MSELAVSRHPAQMQEGSANGSVLIIDDEIEIRESLETLLELDGYSVETANDGEEGLAKMGLRAFDLVLLDFALPDRNGLEILKDIRERDPNMSVIMITAYGTVDNAVKAMQGGAQNFVQKPGTAMHAAPPPGEEEYLAAVAVARVVFGPRMHLQAPPNLFDD